ncbi:MAG: adenylyltransferase/cytidyltransferase family protein [Candidatus Woesearchaeota archaeon]
MAENKLLGRVGIVGRFKPLHLGACVMLEAACDQAQEVIIGIGSAGSEYKYNLRNPFTPSEVKEMINLVLAPKYSNYKIIEVPDFAHQDGCADGQRWVEEVIRLYGKLDHFISGNEWTNKLLQSHYYIIHPVSIITEDKRVYCKGSIVRMALARNEDWQSLVRPEVAAYMISNGLDARFKREFGLETIATLENKVDFEAPETLEAEAAHAREIVKVIYK